MKIIFKSICVDNIPVVWEYDIANNEIYCTFTLSISNMPVDRALLIEKLKGIYGIEILANKDVVIKEAKSFFVRHAFSMVLDLENMNAPPLPPRANSAPNSTFFLDSTRKFNRVIHVNKEQDKLSPGYTIKSPHIKSESPRYDNYSSEQTLESPHYELSKIPLRKYISPRSTLLVEDISTPKAQGIMLDALIPNTDLSSTIWSDTLSYENYFLEKNSSDAKLREYKLIKSIPALFTDLQYKNNEIIYPIKKDIIKTIRHLFDNLLAPKHANLEAPDKTSPVLINYFAKAIHNMMINSSVDIITPTEFELMSSERQEALFPNKYAFDFAIEQALIVRINIVLRPFLFFIQDEIESYHLTNDESLINLLNFLKIQTLSIAHLIRKDIEALQKLLIQLRKNAHEKSLREDNLAQSINQHAYSINGFISFHSLIKQLFLEIPNLKIKDTKLNRLIEKLKLNTIEIIQINWRDTKIAENKIAILRNSESDFYLSEHLANALREDLRVLLIEKQSDKKSFKKIKELPMDEICRVIKMTIEEQVTKEVTPDVIPSEAINLPDGAKTFEMHRSIGF